MGSAGTESEFCTKTVENLLMGVRCDIVFILDQALVHLLQSYFYGNLLTPFLVDAFRCLVQPRVRPLPDSVS